MIFLPLAVVAIGVVPQLGVAANAPLATGAPNPLAAGADANAGCAAGVGLGVNAGVALDSVGLGNPPAGAGVPALPFSFSCVRP